MSLSNPSLPTAARWLIPVLAVLATLATAGRAEAGLLVSTASNCDEQKLSRPFLPWLDLAQYTLVPGGTFGGESHGWQLSDAQIVGENEPWNVGRDATAASLRVNSAGVATSPTMCVGLEHPTLRFFAKRAGSHTAPLNVDVLFEDARGEVQSLRIASVSGHSNWAPTLPYAVVANLLALLPGSHTAVAFRFTSGGAWLIDDVYVDPYKKG